MSPSKKIAEYKAGRYRPKNRVEALKLHCADCCGGEPHLASDCECSMCLLYLHNPWRLRKNKRAEKILIQDPK